MRDYCTLCRAFHHHGKHLPEFRAGIPEYHGDDVSDYPVIRANDPEEAAVRFAEQFDSGGDYTIMGGSDQVVFVLDAYGKLSKWRVSGEAIPSYHAREIEEVTPSPSPE